MSGGPGSNTRVTDLGFLIAFGLFAGLVVAGFAVVGIYINFA